jgi:acetylornithine deacetylase/succinyl-diaminopimelate desuccinylase-like protein
MLPPLPALLADLVRLPSVNPMGRSDLPPGLLYEARITDYLEARLRDLGVPCRRQPVAPGRDNLIARYDPPTPAPFTALWEAHQDTVPTDGMTVEPFAAAVEGGRLYGRGACDVKAGIACMLAAFARLVREKPAGAAVVLAFTVDEEHTFLGVQHLMRSGVRADGAVVAEPTGLNIVTAHKGVVRWRVETAGRACHSSRPQDGENAVYHMARVVNEVENYAGQLSTRPPHPALGPPTLSLGRIEGGTSPNTVPDFCRIDLDRRLLPGESAAEAVADLERWLRNEPLTAAIPYSFSPPVLACPPLDPASSGELTARLGQAIDAVIGSHQVTAVPYGTDASTIAQAGVPAVVFGPGDIAQAHTRDEWVELAQVEQAAEVLYRFARGG